MEFDTVRLKAVRVAVKAIEFRLKAFFRSGKGWKFLKVLTDYN